MKNWMLIKTEAEFDALLTRLRENMEVVGAIPEKYPACVCPRLSTNPETVINVSYNFKGCLHPIEYTEYLNYKESL